MSWRLLFFRRVGEPALTRAEVEEYFATRSQARRAPSVTPDNELRFEFAGGDPAPEFAFSYAPDEYEPEDRRLPDFPFEQTRLFLEASCEIAEDSPDLGRLFEELEAVTRSLGLLVLDPQVEQELPEPPYRDRLARSYAQRCRDIRETIRYLEARKRRLLHISGALLLAALALGALSLLGGR